MDAPPAPVPQSRNSYDAVPKSMSVQVGLASDAPVFTCDFRCCYSSCRKRKRPGSSPLIGDDPGLWRSGLWRSFFCYFEKGMIISAILPAFLQGPDCGITRQNAPGPLAQSLHPPHCYGLARRCPLTGIHVVGSSTEFRAVFSIGIARLLPLPVKGREIYQC